MINVVMISRHLFVSDQTHTCKA